MENNVKKLSDSPEIWLIDVKLKNNPLRNLNSYVICGEEQNLIIDTGFDAEECREELWSGIEEINLDMAKTALFVTHGHSDHFGQAPLFAEKNCTIYMNENDYEYYLRAVKGETIRWLNNLYIKEGYPEDSIGRQDRENHNRVYLPGKIFPVTNVSHGDVIDLGGVECQCIHTPGHSPGHMVLYIAETQMLFTGDHVLFDISPNIGIWADGKDPLAEYLNSLHSIKNLPVQTAFPAHRSTPRKDIYSRIDELIEHHDKRIEEIIGIINSNPGIDAYSIAGKLSWSARGLDWESFPPHQKWFAVGETLSHLYYLVNKRLLNRTIEGNHVGYTDII